jgi:hypothetical protein
MAAICCRTTTCILLVVLCVCSTDAQDKNSTPQSVSVLLTLDENSPTPKIGDIAVYLERTPAIALSKLTNASSAPIDVIVLIDTSSSATRSKVLAETLPELGNFLSGMMVGFPASQYATLGFTSFPELVHGFTTDPVGSHPIKLIGGGGSAFWDALVAAAKLAPDSPGRRKILIVLTDGVDNQSRHTREETMEALAKSGLCIYSLWLDTGENAGFPGRDFMRSLAILSGGWEFDIYNRKEAAKAFTGISRALENQYVATFEHTVSSSRPSLTLDYKSNIKGLRVHGPHAIGSGQRN